MYAVAISYTDSRGNDKVKAFQFSVDSEVEALGKTFMSMTKSIVGDFVVKAWDVVASEDLMIDIITPMALAGKKILAIKTLRDSTGLDLKSAKNFVDTHYDRIRGW